jgi:enoyl-CoA hydratase
MLGFPECELGLMPGFGGTLAQQSGVARSVVMELALTGKLINGEEAATMGLVKRSVPAQQVEQDAIAFAESLVHDRPGHLIRSVMTSIHNACRMTRENALREETRLFCELARKSVGGEQ